jgi:DNA-binding NtrC family response regulator
MSKPVAKISTEAMTRLEQYPWPGNVRELENVIERAVALETSSAILAERLPKQMSYADAAASGGAGGEPLAAGFSLDEHLRTIEANLVRRALEQSGGDRALACSLLGISPRSLRYLLEKHRGVLAS